MKEYTFVVDVPDIEEGEDAYNPYRPISSLLMNQVRHLHTVEQHLPAKDRTGININTLHTELDASNYIKEVTKKLHPAKKQPRKTAKKRSTPKKGIKSAKKKVAKRRTTTKSKTTKKRK